MNTQRFVSVDLARTLAIMLMVAFHLFYDLRTFGYYQWDIPDGAGWKEFRYLILALFFVCVGIGLTCAHKKTIRWNSFMRRQAQIALGAVLITGMSLFLFPDNWIYFGVLHCIFVVSILALPFVRYPRVALVVGVALILYMNLGDLSWRWPFAYFYPWLSIHPKDYVPMLPWLGVTLFGVALGHSDWLMRDPLRRFPHQELLVMPGKHSLLIYLVHQPVIIGAIFIFQKI